MTKIREYTNDVSVYREYGHRDREREDDGGVYAAICSVLGCLGPAVVACLVIAVLSGLVAAYSTWVASAVGQFVR